LTVDAATKDCGPLARAVPRVRFVLGMRLAAGSGVELRGPPNLVIVMSGVAVTAWLVMMGFAVGVGSGLTAVKKGISLVRADGANRMNGYVLPVLMAGILVLALATTLLKSSESGPGSMHASILMSLIGGLVFGAVAQKSRMCFAGSIRDVILMRNFDLLTI